MVKGVNKTIIEINDTGNKYFDRVLFFVNPDYAGTPQSKLQNRAFDYIETNADVPRCTAVRTRVSHRRRNILIAASAVIIAAVAIILLI